MTKKSYRIEVNLAVSPYDPRWKNPVEKSRYLATPEEQNEFARKHPGEVVICLTVPSPRKD